MVSALTHVTRWDTIRLLCRLSGCWLKPGDPVSIPAAVEWEPLIEAASSQLVTPALGFALRGRTDLPQEIADYLAAVLFLTRERNDFILGGLAKTLEAFRAVGIRPVLMKGGASIVSGLYPDPAMRIVTDIDLLITINQTDEAARLLANIGFIPFQSNSVNYSQHHHLRPQYDPATGLVIELHVRPLLNRWHRLIDARTMIDEARVTPFCGDMVFIPSPTHRVIQNIVHNQLSDGNYARRRIDARQMLELAALIYRHSGEIDWLALRGAFNQNDQLITLQDTLEIAENLFGAPANTLIGRSGNNPMDGLESEVHRSDLNWLIDRFVTAFTQRPRTLLRIFRPRSWRRLVKAMRRDMRGERW